MPKVSIAIEIKHCRNDVGRISRLSVAKRTSDQLILKNYVLPLRSIQRQIMNLVEGSISVLKHASFYLERISDAQYTTPIDLLSNSTIGQHTRHFLEFYQCLLKQAEAQVINYCLRERDHGLETNTEFAVQGINEIIHELSRLDLNSKVTLYSSKEAGEAIESTIKREVFYNIEHCIHHLALIKVGLKIISPDLLLPEHFGVAPSTVHHRESLAQS